MSERRRRETEFAADLRAAAREGPRRSANLLLFTIVLAFAAAIFWASRAPLDEVTVGTGRVIPSSQIQVVQNLEGGILSEILIREGEIVKVGQTLLRIDDTGAASTFRENRARTLSLEAQIARLKAEIDGGEPKFSSTLEGSAPTIARERALFRARRAELDSSISILRRQEEQRQQEIVEVQSKVKQLETRMTLANQELGIIEPMVKKGVTSRVELLRLQRQVAGLNGELHGAKLSIPRIRSALSETRRRIEERRATFRKEAQIELNESAVRLNILKEAMTAVADRVRRTEVKSPVFGTIKQLKINTIGGVIRPGMDLLEIVPLEDNLLIEAQVRPSDIAFLRPGQAAKVKITAYDFAQYGSLEAKLEHISADTIIDEKGESYYQIRVRTDRSYLGKTERPLPIIPGMVAQVDILTGKKTVLDY
ncbi:MAG: HlyD family type I secretion periplasmic adaptor subunit, partial [Proteobacteria bacterium]|nr:HlyD family type I secretion periplasmic adaptor subunit [Pseudomonadota bacterium]